MQKRKIIISIFLIFIYILASCTFNEPVLPNWETLWEIPLPDISFKMSEVIDNEYIFADTTAQNIPILVLSIADSMQKEGIPRENLSIKPDPDTLSTTIKRIEISSPGVASSDPVSIHDIITAPVQIGSTIVIPQGTTVPLPDQYITFSTFQYANVNAGKILLEFHNQTFLNIDDSMQINVYDDSLNQFIGTSTFPAIGKYSSETAIDSLDIAGKFITRRLRLELTVPLEPQSHVVIQQDTSGFTQIDALISNMIVDSAFARIPQQTSSATGAKSVMERDNRVIEAVVDEGTIYLNIENQLQVESNVIVTLPNFQEQSGNTFSYSQFIPAASQRQATINLDGLRMYNFNSPGSMIDSLYYQINVITTPQSDWTHISGNDSVKVAFDADSIFFREFEGIIDTVEVAIDTIKKEDIIDYSGFEGGVRFENLLVELNIYNEIGIPVDMIVNIRGEHKNADTGQLENYLEMDPIPVHLAPGSSTMPSENTVTLTESNSKIVELMEILPTDILLNGSATILGQGSVTINDSIWGDFAISTPFNIFIDSIPDYNTDLDTLNKLDDDIKDAIATNFQNATFEFNYENELPLDANVIIIFSKDTSNFFVLDTSDTNKLIIDEFMIQSGIVGSNGYVSEPFTDKIVPVLREEQVKIFSADTLYFGSKIIFPEVSKAVKFRSSDAFNATGALQFKVFMNPEK